jgi:hypothetical protein
MLEHGENRSGDDPDQKNGHPRRTIIDVELIIGFTAC